jgi:Ser/Thr protein kinase RdoA (MazF antagonist)
MKPAQANPGVDEPHERMASALRERYGLGRVDVGEPLEGGFANDLFRVVADGRTFVLRIKHSELNEEDLAWEHRVVGLLADRLDEVQAPVGARDRTTFFVLGGRAASLLPFVEGAAADATHREHRREAARALGRLHRAGVDVCVAPRPRLEPLPKLDWPPLVVPPELEDWRTEIEQAREWATRYVSEVAAERELPMSLVHGDFFPGNVLIADGKVVALIDWEEANLDWLTWTWRTRSGRSARWATRLTVTKPPGSRGGIARRVGRHRRATMISSFRSCG